MVMICYSHQEKKSSSKVVRGTSPPPNRFIKSAHLPIRGSRGVLIETDTLGRSVGTISKKKENKIVPYPKFLVYPFLIEVSWLFRLARRGVHQSNTVVRQSTAKLMASREAWCKEDNPFTLAIVNRMILNDKLSTCLIGILLPTFSG